MQHDDVKWRRFFGGVLVGGPIAGSIVLLLISGRPESLLLTGFLLIVPIMLGIWLLTRKQ